MNRIETAMKTIDKIIVTGCCMLVIAVMLSCASSSAPAQQQFETPDEAAQTLATAVRAGDLNGILAVLGPDGRDIATSGDKVEDQRVRNAFLEAYDRKHGIVFTEDGKVMLTVGPVDWPFPIPLVRRKDHWVFDAAAGRDEILARRIGRNELDAIQACLAYVDAQNEYAERNPDRNGGYARRILSSPGKRDGLYWKTAASEELSPLGEAVVLASAEGYRFGQGRIPYHGYYFTILTRQGRDAPGGAVNYVVRGKMIGGFALVAYPAEYGNSGVMTFIVSYTGIVYQKDLGPRTAQIAGQMDSFNPDRSWQKIDTLALPAQ